MDPHAALGGLVTGLASAAAEIARDKKDIHALSDALARTSARASVKRHLPELGSELQEIEKSLGAIE